MERISSLFLMGYVQRSRIEEEDEGCSASPCIAHEKKTWNSFHLRWSEVENSVVVT